MAHSQGAHAPRSPLPLTEEARRQVLGALPLAHHLAGADEDLYQDMALALCRLAARGDTDNKRGKFTSRAYPRLIGTRQDHGRTLHGRRGRAPKPAGLPLVKLEPTAPGDELSADSLLALLDELCGPLTPLERSCVRGRLRGKPDWYIAGSLIRVYREDFQRTSGRVALVRSVFRDLEKRLCAALHGKMG